MSDRVPALIAAAIVVPILGLILWWGVRNLFRQVGNVRTAIDEERDKRRVEAEADAPQAFGRKRSLDAARLRDEEATPSAAGRGIAMGHSVTPAASAETPASRIEPPVPPMASTSPADFFKEQARIQDDALKAELKSHVDRPVPPLTSAGAESIERAAKARLAIKHVFPPRHPQRSMSYLGGLPIVPQNFDWPLVHDRKGLLERLTFMAQVDCADIPPGPGRDLLPAKGFLYFFAPLSDNFGPDACHFVTRYLAKPVTKTWEPTEGAFSAKLPPNDPIDETWRGRRNHFDRVEIDFGWIEEPSDEEVAARRDEGHAFEVADIVRKEKEDGFFGPTPAENKLLWSSEAPKDAAWIPFASFPANWKTLRILHRFVQSYYLEESGDVTERLTALGEVADDHPEKVRLQALQREIGAVGSKMFEPFRGAINLNNKDHDAPSDEEKGKALAFLDDIRLHGIPSSKDRPYRHLSVPGVINRWIQSAAVHGAEAGLIDPDGAALIPTEVIDALATRHAPRKHHMLGEGEVVQVAADEMKDRYILLMQLGPDQSLDWLVGEMGPLQYWITPEDLAAKKFENTVLTIEAY
ncbi:DUF1963 domain-containing protein [Sphingomonas sp. LY160]|uniref:DUF1963 domain-containing protein n=1 Tax=Sphingomonas sp. LY160 TaxID=3095342 RepID=UPI002ADEA60C|nr:DUF1963 domain-containing protein [Sphingomonas sp. LY160]MEA1071943.1 DUF1963 domain-containing protein [Sphingomonas sp. LY160]